MITRGSVIADTGQKERVSSTKRETRKKVEKVDKMWEKRKKRQECATRVMEEKVKKSKMRSEGNGGVEE